MKMSKKVDAGLSDNIRGALSYEPVRSKQCRECRVQALSLNVCTRGYGHTGDHIAHDVTAHVLERWEQVGSKSEKGIQGAEGKKGPSFTDRAVKEGTTAYFRLANGLEYAVVDGRPEVFPTTTALTKNGAPIPASHFAAYAKAQRLLYHRVITNLDLWLEAYEQQEGAEGRCRSKACFVNDDGLPYRCELDAGHTTQHQATEPDGSGFYHW
jgi:hypothetical protein